MWALQSTKVTVWYVCPSEGQAKKVYREIFNELAQKNLVKYKIASKGDIYIQLPNDSKIEFKSAASEDTLRGSSVNYLVLDECSFIKRSTIEEIVLPTMAVSGRKILAISTPKGKNFFYELWLRAFNTDEKVSKDYKSFKFSSKDNPKAVLSLIEQFKLSLPDAIYRQEFEADWVDSEAVFQNIKELAVIQPLQNHNRNDRYYMGIDIALAATGDYTVITILNHHGDMVYMDRFRGVEAPALCERILQAYAKFSPVKTIIEQNNQGLPIIQYLEPKIKNMEGFYTTNESKSLIINQLIAAFSHKEIRVLNDDVLKAELEAFIFKFSPTGKIRFEAASGFNDDCVMSLAFAWHNYVLNKRDGGYVIYDIDKHKKINKDDEPNEFIIFGR